MVQCIILAGGLGTRVREIAKGLPKCLIPFNGKPFLWYQLKLLERNNIDEVVLCLGMGHQHVQHVLERYHDWPFKLTVSLEGSALRGTGGAVLNAIQTTNVCDAFMLMYGDSYLPIDFQRVWSESEGGLRSLMTVYAQGDSLSNNVQVSGGKIAKYSKNSEDWVGESPTHIDYGLLVLHKGEFARVNNDAGNFDLSIIVEKLVANNELHALEIKQQYFEIGSIAGIQRFQRMLDWNTWELEYTLDYTG